MALRNLMERRIVVYLQTGEWQLDDAGQIWRTMLRRSGRGFKGAFRLLPCDRCRVDRLLPSGYMAVTGTVEGHRAHVFAHRLIWQFLKGDIPNELTINHIDGDKTNNLIGNLELASYSRQRFHAFETGLAVVASGERNPGARVSDADVESIRRMYADGRRQSDLAGIYGVSVGQISRIILGQQRIQQPGPIVKHRRYNTLRGEFRSRA